MTKFPDLVDTLRSFNRKERYWVMRNALGSPSYEPPLSENFRRELEQATGATIPDNAWWGLDYHIDWLFGVMFHINPPETTDNNLGVATYLTGTQQDFDFVVAFKHTLILIEAKCVTRADPKQAKEKAGRLTQLEPFASRAGVTMKFIEMYPRTETEMGKLRLWFDDPDEDFRVVNRTNRLGREWRLGLVKKPLRD